MEGSGHKNPSHFFLTQCLVRVERWCERVRIRFAKLDEALPGTAPGPPPFWLILTGIPGIVTLNWGDPALFSEPAADPPKQARRRCAGTVGRTGPPQEPCSGSGNGRIALTIRRKFLI